MVSEDLFRRDFPALYDVLETAREAAHLGRTVPALILLYSAIDAVAALERADNELPKKAFTCWVEKYLLPAGQFACTPLEVYAARCAVLHTFGSESHLSRTGKVRQISYAWGTGDVSKLQTVLDAAGLPGVAVSANALMNAFHEGFASYLDEAAEERVRVAHVQHSLNAWFTSMPKSTVEEWVTNVELIRLGAKASKKEV